MSTRNFTFSTPHTSSKTPPRSRDDVSTLAKAAKTIKVTNDTLRTLLEAEGRVRKERIKGSPIEVEKSVVARLAQDYEESISFAAVAPMLGVGRKIAERLRDTQELPVWIPGGKNGAKHRYLFRKADIQRWVASLIGDAPILTSIPECCLLLADTPNRMHIPVEALIKAIRSQRVSIVGRLVDRPHFGAAVLRRPDVDAAVPAEIRQAMGSQRRTPRSR